MATTDFPIWIVVKHYLASVQPTNEIIIRPARPVHAHPVNRLSSHIHQMLTDARKPLVVINGSTEEKQVPPRRLRNNRPKVYLPPHGGLPIPSSSTHFVLPLIGPCLQLRSVVLNRHVANCTSVTLSFTSYLSQRIVKGIATCWWFCLAHARGLVMSLSFSNEPNYPVILNMTCWRFLYSFFL